MSVAELPENVSLWPATGAHRPHLPHRAPSNGNGAPLAGMAAAPPWFLAELVEQLPDLQRRTRALAGRTAHADDLVQETCRRALEAHARFVPGTDFRAWLFRIAKNLHTDHLRRACREVLAGDAADSFLADERQERARWREVSDDEVNLALATLSPTYRRTYLLHAIQGKSYAAIARALHIPVSTVGTRLWRAREHLRRLLTPSATA
jgi:RNA polymerase sigma-70 factor (ECF subfamily)